MRPALTRALAAYGTDPKVRETMAGLVMKGQAFFRSAVIEALGDYKRDLRGRRRSPRSRRSMGRCRSTPRIALGKIGDKSSLPTLAGLQRTAPRESQPAVAAAICLLGVNCESHQPYLAEHAAVRDRDDRLPGTAARVGVRRWRRSPSPAARRRPRS